MGIQFVQEGSSIDYSPAADVAAGVGVIQKYLFGVTKSAILAGKLGALAIEGVFDVPKVAGGGESFETGDYVLFTVATQQAHPIGVGGDAFIGRAIADAADADATVRVKLLY
ncbi:MAG: capsid cement protein [Planctomycetota bacterium]